MKLYISSAKQLISLLINGQSYYKFAMDLGIDPPTIRKVTHNNGGLKADTFFRICEHHNLIVFIQKHGEELILTNSNELRRFAITLAKYEGKKLFFVSTRCRWERGMTPRMSVFFNLLEHTGHKLGVMSND